jgi:hypothetical protein
VVVGASRAGAPGGGTRGRGGGDARGVAWRARFFLVEAFAEAACRAAIGGERSSWWFVCKRETN